MDFAAGFGYAAGLHGVQEKYLARQICARAALDHRPDDYSSTHVWVPASSTRHVWLDYQYS